LKKVNGTGEAKPGGSVALFCRFYRRGYWLEITRCRV